jgi:hypothetical protein
MADGDQLTGFDLGDMSRASLRPLLELAECYAQAQRKRDGA